jgi:hypothetical protein
VLLLLGQHRAVISALALSPGYLIHSTLAAHVGTSCSCTKPGYGTAALPSASPMMDITNVSDVELDRLTEQSDAAQGQQVDDGALAAKMANTISQASELQRTYLPVDPASVARADAARLRGRAKLRSENKSS